MNWFTRLTFKNSVVRWFKSNNDHQHQLLQLKLDQLLCWSCCCLLLLSIDHSNVDERTCTNVQWIWFHFIRPRLVSPRTALFCLFWLAVVHQLINSLLSIKLSSAKTVSSFQRWIKMLTWAQSTEGWIRKIWYVQYLSDVVKARMVGNKNREFNREIRTVLSVFPMDRLKWKRK